MTDEKEPEGDLIRVKADHTGVDLAIGRSVPGVLSRLLPAKYRLRRAVDLAISERIVNKIAHGEHLDEAEATFAADMLSEHAQKFIRLERIEARARDLGERGAVPLLPPAATAEQSAADPHGTATDWVNKFREDASLVDDEVVREIHARVLSAEDSRPGASTLRTLGVLRYLDSDVATVFGCLQKVLINDGLVPQQSGDRTDVLHSVGLDHATMLALSDAGLVNSAVSSKHTSEGEVCFFRLPGHNRILGVQRKDRSRMTVNLEVHVLTAAGQQLARIAECEPDESALSALVSWIRQHVGDAELAVATLPSRSWNGPPNQLHWTVLETKAAQQGAPADGAGVRS